MPYFGCFSVIGIISKAVKFSKRDNMTLTQRCVFASMLVFALSSAVLADFNAATFVNQFNSANAGNGVHFTWSLSESYNETQLNFTPGAVNLSAYNSNTSGTYTTGVNPGNYGKQYFRTFCVEPNITTGPSYGQLSYNTATKKSSVSSTNSAYNDKAVNLGTAVLYSQFASGALLDYSYTNTSLRPSDALLLQDAIRTTMGITTNYTNNWAGNKYLNQLLNSNYVQGLDYAAKVKYWMGDYDPNQHYSEVGNYAVFVLNMTSSATKANWQDHLYVVKADYDTGVPEPATLLFWLGGLTFAGAKLRRRK